MTISIVIGSKIRWASQAGGCWKTKEGVVVQVVPAKKYPNKKFMIASSGLYRNHESYVVQVGKKYYWPRVSALSLVEASVEGPTEPEPEKKDTIRAEIDRISSQIATLTAKREELARELFTREEEAGPVEKVESDS